MKSDIILRTRPETAKYLSLKVTDFGADMRPFYRVSAPAEARTPEAVEACELALSVWRRTGHPGIHHRGFIVEVEFRHGHNPLT